MNFTLQGVGSLSQGPQGPTGPQGPAGTGDMNKSTYDTNNNGIVDAAASVPWSGITSVPSTFTPSAHTHPISDITGLATILASKAKTKMRVFTDGGSYTPTSGTTSIIVYLTGSGGSGGSTSVASNGATTAYSSSGGSGAGTLIFSMDATSSDLFQISIGQAPPTSSASSSSALSYDGSPSTFAKIISGSSYIIATAPGGLKGQNNISANSSYAPNASATITAPNATYVAASNYLAIRGGFGSYGILAYATTTAGSGGASGGNGGSSFWGQGALGSVVKSGTYSASGSDAISYGSGGAGGTGLKTAATAISATGGRGAPGICIIIEVLN